jgi:holliday junction DNA helicase RuvA
MIGKLSGLLDYITQDHILLDVNGVGYSVYISSQVMMSLPPVGSPLSLFIEMQMGEDFMRLYGFTSRHEREWFRLLLSVQGVGARVALSILSSLSTEALTRAIVLQDRALMSQAQGVGPKLATRLLMELKDKATQLIKNEPQATPLSLPSSHNHEQQHKEDKTPIDLPQDKAEEKEVPKKKTGKAKVTPPASEQNTALWLIKDALSALTNLGYAPAEAHQAVVKAEALCQDHETPTTLDTLIRLSLKELSRK